MSTATFYERYCLRDAEGSFEDNCDVKKEDPIAFSSVDWIFKNQRKCYG